MMDATREEVAALDRIKRRPPYDLALLWLRMEHVLCFGCTAREARALGLDEAQERADEEMRGLQEHLHYLRTGEE